MRKEYPCTLVNFLATITQNVKVTRLETCLCRVAYKMLGPNAFLNFEISQAEKDQLDSVTEDEFIKQVKLAAEEGNLTRKSIHKTSQFRGVCYQRKKWYAYLLHGAKKLHLGTFNSEEEAAVVYDQALLKRDGPEALTNAAFPTLLSNEALERRLEMQVQRKKKKAEGIDTTHSDDGIHTLNTLDLMKVT